MTRRNFTLSGLLAWLWPWSRKPQRAPWDLSDEERVRLAKVDRTPWSWIDREYETRGTLRPE